jgi:hypothetical protein
MIASPRSRSDRRTSYTRRLHRSHRFRHQLYCRNRHARSPLLSLLPA